jgi:uncharacterized protein YoxC
MPRKQYDNQGKLYAWSDEGFMLNFMVIMSSTQLGGSITTEEFKEFSDFLDKEFFPKQHTLGDMREQKYDSEDLHGTNHDIVYFENKEYKQATYLSDAGLDKAREFIDKTRAFFDKKAEEVPEGPKYDKIREYYRTCSEAFDYKNGNMLEACTRNPYILSLYSMLASAPKFEKYGYDGIIDGMNNATDSKGNKHQAFEAYMDLCMAFKDELAADYLRQKYEDEGWTREKEDDYLQTLKKAHESTLAKYEKVWNIEDNKQYDDFLNNTWDHAMGRDPSNERNVTKGIGFIRGELKAIENGWRPGELEVLGFVGHIDSELERRKIQYKDNPAVMKKLEEFEEDFKPLKEEVWNKNIADDPRTKGIFARKIKNVILPYTGDIGFVTGAWNTYGECINRESNKAQENAKKEIEEAKKAPKANEKKEQPKEEKKEEKKAAEPKPEEEKIIPAMKEEAPKEKGEFTEVDDKTLEALNRASENEAIKSGNIKAHIYDVVEYAKEKLDQLDKITKKGHNNSDEYKNMRNALKTLSEIDLTETTLEKVSKAIDDVKETSKVYRETHDVWNKAFKKFGQKRLNMAVDLEGKATAFQQTFNEISEGMDTKKSIRDLVNDKRATLDKIEKEVKTRNLSLNDLKNKVGVGNADNNFEVKRKSTVHKNGLENDVAKGTFQKK